jgi:hypothetical protein
MAYLCSDVVRTNPEDRQTHASIPPWIFHAAWCWAENFIPFFVSKGIQWRAGVELAAQKLGRGQEKIMEHVSDLESSRYVTRNSW